MEAAGSSETSVEMARIMVSYMAEDTDMNISYLFCFLNLSEPTRKRERETEKWEM